MDDFPYKLIGKNYTCDMCGKVYTAHNARQRFCSKKCSTESGRYRYRQHKLVSDYRREWEEYRKQREGEVK